MVIVLGVVLAGRAMASPVEDSIPETQTVTPLDVPDRPMPSIPPTHGNVSYGKHERDVMDFWQAKSDKPTPVVICIHGGGWSAG
jgi:acetyl esterase/lipase